MDGIVDVLERILSVELVAVGDFELLIFEF